jgi:hypothetical protein
MTMPRLLVVLLCSTALLVASGVRAQTGTSTRQAWIGAPDTVALHIALCERGPRDTVVVIRNSGTSDLMITSVTLERDTSFRFLSAPAVPTVLAPGDELPVSVRYDPSMPGDAIGDLVVRSNAANGSPLAIRLHGRWESATLRALSVYFGAVPSTAFPATQTFPVHNDGTVPVELTSATFGANPPFDVISGVPDTIQPNGTGLVTVRFNDPGPDSYFSDTLTIAHTPSCQPLRILVAGSKYSRPTVEWPRDVRFADLVCDPVVRDTTLVVENTGDFDLYLTSATITGSQDFSLLSPLTRVIGIGRSDTINVRFAPTTFGPQSATLSIANNSSNAPSLPIALSGWVLRASLSAGSAVFGDVAQSQLPVVRRVMLRNTGEAPVAVDSLRFSTPSPFRIVGGLPVTIVPGDSAGVDIEFSDPGADLSVADTARMHGAPACALVRIAAGGTRLSKPRIEGPVSITLHAPPCDPSPRDTVITIRNRGGKTLRVDLITLTGDARLRLVAPPPTPFDLAPGAARPLTLRHDASIATPVSATLTVVSDAENAPIYSFPVFADRDSIVLAAAPLDAGVQRPVQLPQVRSVVLVNTGSVDVTATSLTLDDGSVFRIVSVPPVIVPAGQQRPVDVEIRDAGTNGVFTDILRIASVPACTDLAVALRVERMAMPGIDAPAQVEFPSRICDTTPVDTMIVVTNSGDLPLVFDGGALSADPDLQLLFLSAPRTLAPRDTVQARVRIAPTVPGLRSGVLALRFGARGDTVVSIPIALRSDLAALAVSALDTDTLFTGEAATLHRVPVRNTGTVPVTITALTADADFAVVSSLPVTIPPGDTALVTLRFEAGSGDTVLARMLAFTAAPLCTPIALDVRGVRIAARLHVEIPTLRASVGDRVTVPIRITEARNLVPAGTGTVDLALRIRSSILAPLATPPRTTSGGWDHYHLQIALPQSDTTEFGLAFRATLGLDSTTGIHIDSLVVRTPRAIVASATGGSFTLDDICREGGDRFFDASTTFGITSVRPNPFNPRTTVTIRLIESAPTRIVLVDASGREVQILREGWMDAGTHDVVVDATALPSGSYRCLVITPTLQDQHHLLLVR